VTRPVTMPTPNKFDAGTGVAFLGPAGTYSHAAAKSLFGEGAPWQPVGDIGDVFAAVESGKAIWGVVPVENSSEGSVTATLDAFVNSPVRICAEHLLRIHHCLLAAPGTTTAGLRRIFSHPQSLGQCRQYLDTQFPGVERVAASSNAEAARLAAASPGTAAIAGKVAAGLYGLQVLAESIEDTADNTTRFVLLTNTHITTPSGRDKTSLLVSAPDEPGTLFHALEPFFRFGVSLTKLETRPSRVAAWSYAFYVEFAGHVDDANVKATMAALKTLKLDVKWLGSYPNVDATQGQPEQVRNNAMPTARAVLPSADINDVQLIANKKIVILGLGLIGGSIARGLSRLRCGCEIIAVGRNASVLQQAQADGSVTTWSTDPQAVCKDADLIVLGMPVLSIEQSLKELAPILSPTTIVTDVASGGSRRSGKTCFWRSACQFCSRPSHRRFGAEWLLRLQSGAVSGAQGHTHAAGPYQHRCDGHRCRTMAGDWCRSTHDVGGTP
jgi:chorismate mutase / prephenate dehydratase